MNRYCSLLFPLQRSAEERDEKINQWETFGVVGKSKKTKPSVCSYSHRLQISFDGLVYRLLPPPGETISPCQVTEEVEGTDLPDEMVSHMTHDTCTRVSVSSIVITEES